MPSWRGSSGGKPTNAKGHIAKLGAGQIAQRPVPQGLQCIAPERRSAWGSTRELEAPKNRSVGDALLKEIGVMPKGERKSDD